MLITRWRNLSERSDQVDEEEEIEILAGMDAAQQLQGSSNSPPPFLVKTYDMVEDPSTNKIVSWSGNEQSFVVWSPLEFARDLLPKYFKHNNFSSFIRQLNTYGFRKSDPDSWEFKNEDFVRGRKYLLKNIHRRKPIHSHSLNHQGQCSSGLSDMERRDLEDKIENARRESRDLEGLIQQRQETQLKIQSLKKRLHHILHRQRVVISVAQAVQKSNYPSNFIQQTIIQGKKRRLPKSYLCDDFDIGENHIMEFQTTALVKPETIYLQILEVESSLCSVEKLVYDAARASGEEISDRDPTTPLAAVLSELLASSGDSDVNMNSHSPGVHSSPCNFGDIGDSSELAESADYCEGLVIATPCPVETRPKVNDIDVNMEPMLPDPEASQSSDQSLGISPTVVPPGTNDVFWQQFLTETPGDSQEVQSERRDISTRKNDMKPSESVFWVAGQNEDH